MSDEWERRGSEAQLHISKYYINICRKTLRIMTEECLSADFRLLEIQKRGFAGGNKHCSAISV
jgi:hypothetical protein